MAKFSYRLQPLLNVKRQMEDSLKNELGKAIRKLEHEKNVLSVIEDEQQECFQQLASKSETSVTVGILKQYSSYTAFLRERISAQKENINNAQNNVDIHREQLIKVAQEKEMLNKLREKKYLEFLGVSLKKEQSVVDEIISYNYNGSTN